MSEPEEKLVEAVRRVASELGWIRLALTWMCVIQYFQCVCGHKP